MIPITRDTKSTCPYCGVGCGVVIESVGQHITGVRGDPDHPANFGRLCSKGQSLHLTAAEQVTRQNRLLRPQWRPARSQAPEAIGWDAAMAMASQRLADIVQRHGADAVGFYISGQLLTEDYYVFNKLAKGLLGTNNIDSNSRLCMSSAVAGYKMTLGADAPPACYDDIAHAQCLFIAGSNAAFAHPILFRRIEDAKRANPAQKMIVVDPRRTDTADMADLHLAIQPGTDVMLFHGLLHIMLAQGWTQPDYIAAHTSGFEALQARVADHTPAQVAQICGVAEADLHTAARWFAGVQDGQSQRTPTLSLYCQGLNQSSNGTAKNAALINLHLATQQIGRPGAGPLSLTGQPNAMGGREVGGMANLMSAHRDMANPQHRAEVAALWGVVDVPAKPGLTAVEMFEAAADGQIKALWIACTNPAQSMPDQTTVRRALQRAEWVVVQEAFATASTCDYADLLLPATTWGEKEGTVTNSERRITRVRAAVSAPGQARADWAIAAELGQRLARDLGRPEAAALLAYNSPESVWNEHRESTRGRDLDITGLSYAHLDSAGPSQWPLAEGAARTQPQGPQQGQARLYTDGQFPTPDGRARFAAVAWQPVAEERVSQFPFSLTTGRLRDQWHGMTRTGTAGRLFGHSPEPCVQMNPQDVVRLGLAEGDLVTVRSKRGSLVLPVQASAQLGACQAFIAMHWGPEVLCGRDAQGQPGLGVNVLTTSAYCPNSKQPELKHAAVHIGRAVALWPVLAMAWLPSDRVWRVQKQLQSLLSAFDYAHVVPFAHPNDGLTESAPRTGLLLRAASAQPVAASVLEAMEGALDLAGAHALRYEDAQRAQRRVLKLSESLAPRQRQLQGFLTAGDDRSSHWLKNLLLNQQAMAFSACQWLMATNAPPNGAATQSRQICSCLNVREDAIQACLKTAKGSDDARLSQLKSQLRCGTQCGSCVPELRRMVRNTFEPAPAD